MFPSTFRRLEVFIAVVESGGFVAGAERRQCVDDRSPLRVHDFEVDNSKAKSALVTFARSGDWPGVGLREPGYLTT